MHRGMLLPMLLPMRRTRHITRKNLPADGVLHLRNPAWPGFFVRGF